jgi:DNA-binding transcriptional ArsR family regulator
METTNALAALAALSQESRLAVFRLLVEQGRDGLPAGAIAERLQLAPATLSFHLKELAQARLVAARQDGRFIWYRADFETMNGLVGYLTRNCCQGGAACVPQCAPPVPARRAAVPVSRPAKRRSA